MHNLLKISEATSLALHTMVILAHKRGKNHSTKELAVALGASEAHLAKVLQRMSREGLLRSQRGPKGGFVLDRDPASVTLLDVYQASEGAMQSMDCLLKKPVCSGECILGGLICEISRQVMNYFAKTRLIDLMGSFSVEAAHA